MKYSDKYEKLQLKCHVKMTWIEMLFGWYIFVSNSIYTFLVDLKSLTELNRILEKHKIQLILIAKS